MCVELELRRRREIRHLAQISREPGSCNLQRTPFGLSWPTSRELRSFGWDSRSQLQGLTEEFLNARIRINLLRIENIGSRITACSGIVSRCFQMKRDFEINLSEEADSGFNATATTPLYLLSRSS